MITDGLFNSIGKILDGIFANFDITAFDINVTYEKYDVLRNYISFLAYLIPYKTFLSILGLIIAMFSFRAIIALIRTIWDLIPML